VRCRTPALYILLDETQTQIRKIVNAYNIDVTAVTAMFIHINVVNSKLAGLKVAERSIVKYFMVTVVKSHSNHRFLQKSNGCFVTWASTLTRTCQCTVTSVEPCHTALLSYIS